MDRVVVGWAAAGVIAYALLPWYAIEEGLFSLGWLRGYPASRAAGSALVQAVLHGRVSLLPGALFLAAPLIVRTASAEARSWVLLVAGAGGAVWITVQGFAVGGQPVQVLGRVMHRVKPPQEGHAVLESVAPVDQNVDEDADPQSPHPPRLSCHG